MMGNDAFIFASVWKTKNCSVGLRVKDWDPIDRILPLEVLRLETCVHG